jgi:hypothetical protein
MSYEDILIREATGDRDCDDRCRWCSQCERYADNCVCEEISDHFRKVCSVGMGSDSDVCVPAESESYTHAESDERRKESHL